MSRSALESKLEKGEIGLVVGTHALFKDMIAFNKLALVVIDEQHRFGVQQRNNLLSRSRIAPHLLSMSATPIPRTLALSVFGDLDVSVLDELPQGRKPITTQIIDDQNKLSVYKNIINQIQSGRQVYIVAPLIDPSDVLGDYSVKEGV